MMRYVAKTTKGVDALAVTVLHSYFDGLASGDDEALCFRLCRTFADFAASIGSAPTSTSGSFDPGVCVLLSYVLAKVAAEQKSDAVMLKVLGRNSFPCSHHTQLLRALKTLLLDADAVQRTTSLSRPAFQAVLTHLVNVVVSDREGMALLGSAVEDDNLREEAALIVGILTTFSCNDGSKGLSFADLAVMALSNEVHASFVPSRFVLTALKEAAENAPTVFAKHAKQVLLKLIPSLAAVKSNLIACCYCDLLVATCNAIHAADAAAEEKKLLSGDIASAFPSAAGGGNSAGAEKEEYHASSCGDALNVAMDAVETSWLVSPVAVLQAKATEATGSITLALGYVLYFARIQCCLGLVRRSDGSLSPKLPSQRKAAQRYPSQHSTQSALGPALWYSHQALACQVPRPPCHSKKRRAPWSRGCGGALYRRGAWGDCRHAAGVSVARFQGRRRCGCDNDSVCHAYTGGDPALFSGSMHESILFRSRSGSAKPGQRERRQMRVVPRLAPPRQL